MSRKCVNFQFPYQSFLTREVASLIVLIIDHEQVELFAKRDFQCDCPTSCLTTRCTLHKNLEVPNGANTYGQNYFGNFCRCGRPYDAATEEETMVQCVVCEVGHLVRAPLSSSSCFGTIRIGSMSHASTYVPGILPVGAPKNKTQRTKTKMETTMKKKTIPI